MYSETVIEHCTDLRQRNVVIIIDEIYVKPQLGYQGGHVFGKAVNAHQIILLQQLSVI